MTITTLLLCAYTAGSHASGAFAALCAALDDFERQLVRDVIRTRLPETLRREDVFD